MYDLKLAINLVFKQNLDLLENKNKDRIFDILFSLYKIEKLIRDNKIIKKDNKKIILNNTQFLILSQTFDYNLSLEDFNNLIELKEESLDNLENFSLFCYMSKDYLLKRIENVIQNNRFYSEKFSGLPQTMIELEDKIDIGFLIFNSLIKLYQFAVKNNLNSNNKEFYILKEMYNQQKEINQFN